MKNPSVIAFQFFLVFLAGVVSARAGTAEETTIYLPGDVPLTLVRVPAGSFPMGSPDTERSRETSEGPAHTVTIGYDFCMGKYELTQQQWLAVMGSWPNTEPNAANGLGDNYPAYYISWNDCQNFITALNAHITNTGQGPATFRLPSESEWEYACRAGTQTRFFFGNSLSVDDYATDGPAGTLPGNRSDYMWFGGNNNPAGSKPVGTKLPNQFGLYDMNGNITEWCQDWYHTDYNQPGRPDDGSAWDTQQSGIAYRVTRNGRWDNEAKFCRSAFRNGSPPALGQYFSGVRLARALPPDVSSFAINSGATETNSRVVELNNVCENSPTERLASESSSFSGASWLPYSAAPPFALSAGNETKTVYFKVKNEAGESAVTSDTITLNQPASLEEITINLPGNVPLELVHIPGGSFQMGSPDTERSHDTPEGPAHTVTIEYDYYMGKFELTQQQWLALMGSWPGESPNVASGLGDNYPAYYLTWDDCQDFITVLNAHVANTGQGPATFRLPSEAEWEYACRAGTQTRFFFGDSLSVDDHFADGPAGTLPGNRSDYMWFSFNNSPSGTKEVGTKLPNPFGLYDMHGNAWEWCQDWYHSDYSQPGRPDDGSAWDTQQPEFYMKLIRGGHWNSEAQYCRSASRNSYPPILDEYRLGMRLAQTYVPPCPSLASFAINSGAAETNDRVVSLNNVCSNSPTERIASESSTFSGAAWRPYSTAPSFALSAGNGSKTVYFKTRNAVGESAATSDTITLNEPPSPEEITISLPGDVPLTLVHIPGGSYQMGSPESEASRAASEGPAHSVNIQYDFYMGKYELTQQQWLAVKNAWPSAQPTSTYGVGDNYPAYYISWTDCQSFITALNTHIANTGQGPATFRLPSEAEWEYACRAGTQTRFFFGDSLTDEQGNPLDDILGDGLAGTLPGYRSDYMWFNPNNNPNGSKPVGEKLPNQFGLYDMSGNLFEWCQDWYHTDYSQSARPDDGSAWETQQPGESKKIARGGFWLNPAASCRSAARQGYDDTISMFVGMRLARGIPPSVATFAVNSGAAETTDRVVTLNNVCTDSPTEQIASESASFSGANWRPYSTAPSFALSAGNGTKTVYFKARSAVGESPATSDTITLNEPPSPEEITINLPGDVPLTLVHIPGGSFQMGSPGDERTRMPDEGPAHTVALKYDFYMGKYELTQRQWLAVRNTWPSAPPDSSHGVGDDYPAYYISWTDCQNFITALNTHIANTGQGPATFRLPSEAEWEYACRAGTQTRFYFGDSLTDELGNPIDDIDMDGPAGTLPCYRSDYMWYGGNNNPSGSKPVGTKLPNQFGLYDMSGNIFEWCQDWYHTDYSLPGRPDDGSAWETQQPGESRKVTRSGFWFHTAGGCRSARRQAAYNAVSQMSGMRLARTLAPGEEMVAVSFIPASHGHIEKTPDLALYDRWSTVTLEAVPDAGYHLKAWTGDAAGDESPLILTMNNDKSVGAVFERDTGTVVVEVEPDDAAWYFTDGEGEFRAQSGDGSQENVPTGTITLCWRNLHGYAAPTPNPVSQILGRDETIHFSGQYISMSPEVSAISRPGYVLDTLEHGKLVYGDRGDTFDSIPEFAVGYPYIRALDADRDVVASPFLSFNVDRNVTLFMAMDPRLENSPDWMTGWQLRSATLTTTDSRIAERDLYFKTYPAGTIELGGNRDADMPTDRCMYTVIILPELENRVPESLWSRFK